MSEVKIMVPNSMVDDLSKMSSDDVKKLMALYYYSDYKNGERGLEDIANKINVSIYELVDIYGDMDLPLIVGNVDDYENELNVLDKILK